MSSPQPKERSHGHHELGPARHRRPSDAVYDEARSAWNLAADLRPAAVATATSAEQVAAVVRHAGAQGLRVVPQGTGHLAGGLGDISDAILLKTALGHEIVVDPDAGSVRVGAGAVWQQVLDALAPHGLAALSGSSHDVGVIGYTVGGGLSWFARCKGLASDHVTAIDVVTADGELVRATADDEPDLFWALRGGGGNFGVVTAIEFAVFPVPEPGRRASRSGTASTRRRSSRRGSRSRAGAPATVTTSARILQLPPLPDIPEPLRARPLVAIDGAALGGVAEAEELLAPLRAIAEPIMDTWGGDSRRGADRRSTWTRQGPCRGSATTRCSDRSRDEALDAFLAAIGPGTGSPLLSAELRHVSGCGSHGGDRGGRRTPGCRLHAVRRRRIDGSGARARDRGAARPDGRSAVARGARDASSSTSPSAAALPSRGTTPRPTRGCRRSARPTTRTSASSGTSGSRRLLGEAPAADPLGLHQHDLLGGRNDHLGIRHEVDLGVAPGVVDAVEDHAHRVQARAVLVA